jgi:Holliday junction resolvase-like predicted endonuclease
VIKWDGRKEPFQRKKILRTLIRLGASIEVADRIVKQTEANVYDGITTKEILDMAFKSLEEYKPAVALRKDLRTAIGEIRSAPDFEEYVRLILRAHGYKVVSNRVIQGLCVNHEIDGIAEKNGETIYLEVKHHAKPHTYTPFDVTLTAKAKWDDIKEGYKKGMNGQPFDRVLIVCNTKLTGHAKRYAECIGLDHIGWNAPEGYGLERLIEESKLYPVTILKNLAEKERDILSGDGILTLTQMVENRSRKKGISKSRLTEMIAEAEKVLNSLE